jgi:hypothetical protein
MRGRGRAEGQIRAFGVSALLAAAVVLSTAGSACATVLDYSFSSNNQGWQQSQDNGMTFSPAGFASSGGNPGGRLTAKDTGAETGCSTQTTPCDLLTFYSPFVEKMGANYGGTAAFDLRSSVTPAFAAELLLLPEGPNYLDGLIPTSTGTGYHRLSIKLDETANWAVCPYAGGACTPPSQIVFQNLISDSDEIALIVDVGPDGTGETYDVDNVSVTEGGPRVTPPPPPPTGQPPARKPKCKKRHHRAASAKKRKCRKRRAARTALRG